MENIRQYLKYNPDDGTFVWIKARSKIRVGTQAGSNHPEGYRVIRFDGKPYLAHRLAFYFMTGALPKLEVDHINGNRSDNRWLNLREVTRRQNQFNRRQRGKVPYKGDCFDKSRGKYLASMSINGNFKNLGRFGTPEEAHHAYCVAARALQGEYFAEREYRVPKNLS